MARRTRDQKGAAAVEFALIAPFLLLLIFGAIDFGILFAQNLAMNNAARDAARLGAVENTACEDIASAADDGADSIAMDGSDVDWAYTCGACEGSETGDSFVVTGDYNSTLVLPIPFLDDTFALDAHGEFKCEYS